LNGAEGGSIDQFYLKFNEVEDYLKILLYLKG